MTPHELPGFRVERGGEMVGLLTYRIDGDACEIVTLDATIEQRGIGTALIDATCAAAVEAGCKRLWLITTNDNLDALRFYQRRGFRIVAVQPNAVDESRRLKPSIPEVGAYGIPLRDELELERILPSDEPDCWMESDEGW
jgi:N-acetylglutamate synthase-like GNAT family acetyltransferase